MIANDYSKFSILGSVKPRIRSVLKGFIQVPPKIDAICSKTIVEVQAFAL